MSQNIIRAVPRGLQAHSQPQVRSRPANYRPQRSHPPRCRRAFSTTPLHFAGVRIDPRMANMTSRAQKKAQLMPSMKSLTKSQMGKLTEDGAEGVKNKDLGLIPETFIWPSSARLASFFSKEGMQQRFNLYKKLLKTRAGDFYSVYWFYKRNITPKKPYPKINRATLPTAARDLHSRVYTAFAQGDTRTITNNCIERVATEFNAAISQRRANERLRWEVLRYLDRGTVVSHRATEAPFKLKDGVKIGLRQCVVRIRSVQRLETGVLSRAAPGTLLKTLQTQRVGEAVAPGSLKGPVGAGRKAVSAEEAVDWTGSREEEKTEYLVLQRWLCGREETPWMLWGFTRESSVAKVMDGAFSNPTETPFGQMMGEMSKHM